MLMLILALIPACSDEPTGPAAEAPCCSRDDVVKMCESDLSDELILSTIEAGAVEPELSAQDVIDLNAAGCSDAVILALRGEEAEKGAEEEEGQPPLLSMSVVQGSLFIDVNNLSATTYTNVHLTINGQYNYRIKKLPPNDADSMRKASFKDAAGNKFRGDISALYIRADQGVWSQSF